MKETPDTAKPKTDKNEITRREAIAVGATAAAAVTAARAVPAKTSETGMRPVAVASENGLEAVRRAVERMGLRVRLQIGDVDVPDDLGLGQGKQIVVALQIRRPVRKTLAPIIFLPQPMGLDHGAHGTVEDNDTLLEQPAQDV